MTAYSFSALVNGSALPPLWEAGQMFTVEYDYTYATVTTGDTISTPASGVAGALPNNGIRIIETEWTSTELDTNATPTATLSIGDAGGATRFINAAPAGFNGVTTSGALLSLQINQVQATTAGVVTAGSGYLYPQGTTPVIVVTVGGTVATAGSSVPCRLKVTYRCTGES